jgi:hypothetical protein
MQLHGVNTIGRACKVALVSAQLKVVVHLLVVQPVDMLTSAGMLNEPCFLLAHIHNIKNENEPRG